jgi:hypothetical protein
MIICLIFLSGRCNSDIDSDDDNKEETHACIKKEVVVKKDYNYGDDIITKFKVKNE